MACLVRPYGTGVSLVTARVRHTSIVVGDSLYVIGGYDRTAGCSRFVQPARSSTTSRERAKPGRHSPRRADAIVNGIHDAASCGTCIAQRASSRGYTPMMDAASLIAAEDARK